MTMILMELISNSLTFISLIKHSHERLFINLTAFHYSLKRFALKLLFKIVAKFRALKVGNGNNMELFNSC